MTNQTTKEKGDYFENLSYALIKQKVENSELGIIPSQSVVFQQKGYYSRDREDEIIFDISIEVTLTGADKYFFLYLIECKNYSNNVPVDDLEEFYSKVSQVSGLNVKAMLISNRGFSKGAYKYARSKNISLVEVNSNLTLNIILHKSNTVQRRKIENQYSEYKLDINDPIGKLLITEKTKRVLEKLILSSFIEYVKSTAMVKRSDIPKLSGDDIDEIVVEILKEIQTSFVTNGQQLDLNRVIDFIINVLGYEIIFSSESRKDSSDRNVLASVDFGSKQIVIDSKIREDSRFGFILAHELGHICLHNKLAISQDSYESFDDYKFSFGLGEIRFTNDRQWIEWQANRFASSFLMPPSTFKLVCKGVFQQFGRRIYEPLYVDDNRYSQDDFHKIVRELARLFRTTSTSVIYTMGRYNLINDNSSMKHISKIIKQEYHNIFDNS